MACVCVKHKSQEIHLFAISSRRYCPRLTKVHIYWFIHVAYSIPVCVDSWQRCLTTSYRITPANVNVRIIMSNDRRNWHCRWNAKIQHYTAQECTWSGLWSDISVTGVSQPDKSPWTRAQRHTYVWFSCIRVPNHRKTITIYMNNSNYQMTHKFHSPGLRVVFLFYRLPNGTLSLICLQLTSTKKLNKCLLNPQQQQQQQQKKINRQWDNRGLSSMFTFLRTICIECIECFAQQLNCRWNSHRLTCWPAQISPCGHTKTQVVKQRIQETKKRKNWAKKCCSRERFVCTIYRHAQRACESASIH